MDFDLDFDKEKSPLTPAEMRVFELLVEGKTQQAMSLILHRSIKTVETHLAHIYQKLNVDNDKQAITTAFVRGIVRARNTLVLVICVVSAGNTVLPSPAYADIFDRDLIDVPVQRVRCRRNARGRMNRSGRRWGRKQEKLWLDCFGDF